MHLRPRDMKWFSDLVLRLHGCAHEREVFSTLLPAVHHQFDSWVTQADEMSWDASVFRQHGVLGGFTLPDNYVPATADHPLVQRLFRERRAETMHRGTLVPWDKFTRTNFYEVLFRPIGLRDQVLAILDPGEGFVACFGINRDRTFTPDEIALADHVRRHAEACLRRVRRTRGATACDGTNEIRLTPDLRPLEVAPALASILSAYFPGWRFDPASRRLPPAITSWIREALTSLHAGPAAGPLRALGVESGRGRLWLRLFPGQPHGDTLHLIEEQRVAAAVAAREHGLTTRECEVLHWLAAGKRDAEIGTILGAAPRTVECHVANLRRKLGAHSRGAVAARFGPGAGETASP